MSEDKFTVTVQDDGTIKVETDAIGMANHGNAEEFMRFLARAMGGEVTRTKTGQTHSHAHQHSHEHA
jgi:Cu2+-containing amine oxidase